MEPRTPSPQCFYHFHSIFYELPFLTSTYFCQPFFSSFLSFLMHNLCMKEKIIGHIYFFFSLSFAFYNITSFDKDTDLRQIS